MSDIPRARQLLAEARDQVTEAKRLIDEATLLLERRKPKFKAPRTAPSLTPAQKARARRLRKKGLSLMEIARRLGANHGRISEACNPRNGGTH